MADSNAAADNMVRALRRLNIDVLRLGSEYRIASDVFDTSFQGRMEKHPQRDALQILEREIPNHLVITKGVFIQRTKRNDKKYGRRHFDFRSSRCFNIGYDDPVGQGK